MNFYLVFALIFTTATAAQVNQEWMIWPDSEGNPRVAILNGPLPAPKIDPYLDVLFYLHTRSNPEGQQIWVGNFNNATFYPDKPVKMIVHGYNSNTTEGWVIAMKDAYLRAADVNVVLVEWGELASNVLYNVVKNQVYDVGTYLGVFLDFLVLQGADPSQFHCSGHSLGAHACGIAGKTMQTRLGRVTGYEPALPLYSFNDTTDRLSYEDANFVDIIHTCGGWLGFQLPIGHADFYPNGGVSSQPGCGLDVSGACSHSRSHDLFTESIESNGFVAHLCANWENYEAGLCSNTPISLMGEPANQSFSGVFFLRTRRDPPYAMG